MFNWLKRWNKSRKDERRATEALGALGDPYTDIRITLDKIDKRRQPWTAERKAKQSEALKKAWAKKKENK